MQSFRAERRTEEPCHSERSREAARVPSGRTRNRSAAGQRALYRAESRFLDSLRSLGMTRLYSMFFWNLRTLNASSTSANAASASVSCHNASMPTPLSRIPRNTRR
jgi:hypothetical protein